VDGDDAPVGVTFVVSDIPTPRILDLARSFSPSRGDRGPEVEPLGGRFVVSMVVRPQALPQPLATESFLLPKSGRTIHLHKAAGAAPNTVLLVAETLTPASTPRELEHARAEVLGTVMEFVPFFESTSSCATPRHDGQPLWDLRNPSSGDPFVGKNAWGLRAPARGSRAASRHRRLARARADGATASASHLPIWKASRVSRIRTPLGNVFVTGRSVPARARAGGRAPRRVGGGEDHHAHRPAQREDASRDVEQGGALVREPWSFGCSAVVMPRDDR